MENALKKINIKEGFNKLLTNVSEGFDKAKEGVKDFCENFHDTGIAINVINPIVDNINLTASKLRFDIDEKKNSFKDWAFASEEDFMTDEQIEIVKEVQAINPNDWSKFYAVLNNPEKLSVYRMFSCADKNVPKDRTRLFAIQFSENIDDEIDRIVREDEGFITRIVFYSYAGVVDPEDLEVLSNKSNKFRILVNEKCRKENLPEIFSMVGSPIFSVNTDEPQAAKFTVVDEPKPEAPFTICPVRFETEDKQEFKVQIDSEKEVKKGAKHLNESVEIFDAFFESIMPDTKHSYSYQTNGSVICTVNGYNIVIDPGAIYGNGIYISSYGTTESGEMIFVPVPIEDSELASKVIRNIGYRLNKSETKRCLDCLFEDQAVYRYVDLSFNQLLESANRDEYKELGRNLAQILIYYNDTFTPARFRLKNYKAPNKFELVSDDKVIIPFDQCEKRISGAVITVNPDAIIINDSTFMKSYKFNEVVK